MKTIKFCVLHGSIINAEEDKKLSLALDYLKISLDQLKEYKLVYDEETPDYLFVTEGMYFGYDNKNVLKKFKKLYKTNPVTIFYSGECIEPDLNLFDYALVFDRDLKIGDRICRIPTFQHFEKSLFTDKNEITNAVQAKKELKKKKYFCNFIYSNSRAFERRDQLFSLISKYKKVNSLGKYLNNFSIDDDKINSIKDWRRQSIEIKRLHKFTIASENASYNGYVSEKILTSLQGHSIPIYWGDKSIEEEINPKAFINANKYTDEDLIKKIEEIDNDDELFCKMIAEPWQTAKQLQQRKLEEQKYYEFIKLIFGQEKEKAYRKANGTANTYYLNYFYNVNLFGRLFEKINNKYQSYLKEKKVNTK